MVTKIEDLLDKVVQPISLSQDEKIERLSNETYLERTIFEEWIKILEFKKQMILFSPAGTGKTFVAEKFAEYLISIKGGEYRKVQFHPSYTEPHFSNRANFSDSTLIEYCSIDPIGYINRIQ
jgi:MoxR-like ATPase